MDRPVSRPGVYRAGCPLPVVGVVRSPHTVPARTPVQAALDELTTASVEIVASCRAGLRGLAGFDHAWLLTWLGRPDDPDDVAMVQVPFLLRPQGREQGVFATRSPWRVNPIGLSLVRLLAVEADRVRFAGVDVVDETPVLDIKPYVPRFDRPGGESRAGWFDDVDLRPGVRPDDLVPPGR